MLSEEDEIAQLRTDLASTKTSIKELLNVNVSQHQLLLKKSSLTNLGIPELALRKQISMLDYPKRIYPSGNKFYICTSKDLYEVDSYTKEKNKIYSQPLLDISGIENSGSEFIGRINPTTLLFYDGRNFEKLNLLSKISTARLLKGKRSYYGILG